MEIVNVLISKYPMILSLLVFFVGVYFVVESRNIIKKVIALSLMTNGANMFFISSGFRSGGLAPIFTKFTPILAGAGVDPLPQCLVLTAIVIDMCKSALAFAIVIKLYEHYGTISAEKIRRLRG